MNRRSFLQMLGIGVVAGAAISIAPQKEGIKPQQLGPPIGNSDSSTKAYVDWVSNHAHTHSIPNHTHSLTHKGSK